MHTPMRRCRVCYRQFPKSELQRWTLSDGELVRDESGRAQARGIYTCSPECADKLPQVAKKIKR